MSKLFMLAHFTKIVIGRANGSSHIKVTKYFRRGEIECYSQNIRNIDFPKHYWKPRSPDTDPIIILLESCKSITIHAV